jgi:transposase-like protein
MSKIVSEREKSLSNVVKIDEKEIRDHLSEMVRLTVEETLNKMLDTEADILCKAERYERSPDRVDTRAGYYKRNLHTKAGEVKLNVPKLRTLTFESQIIERYKRRESSVEEALIEMYLAGVSVRRVKDISEALWGSSVSSSTVSSLNKKIYGHIDEWRNRPIEGGYPYVYLDGICLKMNWGGEVKNVSLLVAIGVDSEGYRNILGISEGGREDKDSWFKFLRNLKERGLKEVRLIVSDKCIGLVESISEVFSDSLWQRCVVHWYRNVFTSVPNKHRKYVASMLKAIHAQEDKIAALNKAEDVVKKLRTLKLNRAAETVKKGVHETLNYMCFPQEHWSYLRTNNGIERIMREIRRRTNVVGAFPNVESALMLAGARLRHIASTKWGTRKYLDMRRLYDQEKELVL